MEGQTASRGSLSRGFVPGLVLGLIVGAIAGAFIPPFLARDSGRVPDLSRGPVVKPADPRERVPEAPVTPPVETVFPVDPADTPPVQPPPTPPGEPTPK